MNIENTTKVISLIDKRLIRQLGEKEINIDEIEILSSLKLDYTKELNNLIRMKNTHEMFNNYKQKK